MSRRYLALYFPSWAINVAFRDLSDLRTPGVVLVSKEANQLIVRRASAGAKLCGVKEGMTLSLAKALCREINVKSFDALRDFNSLFNLARWGLKFTPCVGIDYELREAYKKNALFSLSPLHNGIILDITGTGLLYKSEKHLIERIRGLLKKGRIEVYTAIAPTIGAAWGLSRFGRTGDSSASKENLLETLLSLPIQALRVPESTVVALKQVGVTTLEGVFSQQRNALAERFGKLITHRIDQILGRVSETLCMIREPNTFKAHKLYNFPISREESLERCIYDLMKGLFADLIKLRKRARNFLFYFYYKDDLRESRLFNKQISLNAATVDIKELKPVIQSLIESVKVLNGIDEILIVAKGIESFSEIQPDFFETDDDANSLKNIDQLLNILSLQLGRDSIKYARLHESYIPERSYSFLPLEKDHKNKLIKPPPLPGKQQERPFSIFTPEEITAIALLPDKPPSRITWAGKSWRIVTGIGPERISSEWWKEEGVGDRDYFRVQDESGAWLWIFRDNANHKWFLHGAWS